jgi:hypothetical protein
VGLDDASRSAAKAQASTDDDDWDWDSPDKTPPKRADGKRGDQPAVPGGDDEWSEATAGHQSANKTPASAHGGADPSWNDDPDWAGGDEWAGDTGTADVPGGATPNKDREEATAAPDGSGLRPVPQAHGKREPLAVAATATATAPDRPNRPSRPSPSEIGADAHDDVAPKRPSAQVASATSPVKAATTGRMDEATAGLVECLRRYIEIDEFYRQKSFGKACDCGSCLLCEAKLALAALSNPIAPGARRR